MGTNLDLSDLNSGIGQVIMAGMPGPHLDDGTERLIQEYNIGGIILFSRNIQNPLQLAKLCQQLQDMALKCHGGPLFLAVDQEGGRVARLKEPFTLFEGNSALGKSDRPAEKALEFGQTTAKEMKIVGLNMNLAPVVDVQRGDLEKHLAGRSFGEDPATVALLGRTVIASLQENGVMAVAKHFPGLGRTSVDPHFQLPTIDIDLEEMEAINLPPFRAAVHEAVSGIMTSHAIYPAIDPENPATLSSRILTGLLRDQMGFEGLIVTDDLEMGAIAKQQGVAEGACKAFQAGADVLLVCKDQKNVVDSIRLLRNRLLEEEIKLGRLVQSLERIEETKSRFLRPFQKISTAEVREYFRLTV